MEISGIMYVRYVNFVAYLGGLANVDGFAGRLIPFACLGVVHLGEVEPVWSLAEVLVRGTAEILTVCHVTFTNTILQADGRLCNIQLIIIAKYLHIDIVSVHVSIK